MLNSVTLVTNVRIVTQTILLKIKYIYIFFLLACLIKNFKTLKNGKLVSKFPNIYFPFATTFQLFQNLHLKLKNIKNQKVSLAKSFEKKVFWKWIFSEDIELEEVRKAIWNIASRMFTLSDGNAYLPKIQDGG